MPQQAGTLSGNPLAMTAGIKTLEIMGKAGAYDHLENVSKKLIDGILEAGRSAGHDVTGGHAGGMFGFFFAKGPITCFEDASAKADTDKFARWHRGMLERGVYLAPSQYEAGFTSLAHTEEDIQFTINAAEDVMRRI